MCVCAQELDLRVVNLALDLRDGIRLAKLVEAVSGGQLALMKVCTGTGTGTGAHFHTRAHSHTHSRFTHA